VVTALGDLLGDPRAQRLRVGNGFGMAVRWSLSEPPRYSHPEATIGMQLFCPSLEHLARAHADFTRGRMSKEPAVLGMTFTRVDPGLAPPGRHLLYAWAQYTPYDAECDDERVLATIARHAPNVTGAVRARFVQTPRDLEARFGMLRGNVMHLEMDLGQMFTRRPLRGLARYRGPHAGTYLTGAGTHPGGGVFGASGRSAARAVLRDLP
jgi:phytoene dehydrogenase-like protein